MMLSKRIMALVSRTALLVAIAVAVVGRGAAYACPGDCDASGTTTIDELHDGVDIALEKRPAVDCRACDTNTNGAVEVDEIVAAVDAARNGCPATPTPTPTAQPTIAPIFPASYRNTYIEVRNCRFSPEHGGVAIRVLANPVAVQPYLDEQNPLPLGSVVVKEEYTAPDCSDDSKLVRWRAMRKENPGFDSEDGDWHWQWVNRNRSVLFDDKATCIGCHRAAACVARDFMCTHAGSGPTLPPLRVVFDGLPPALLGVAGTSPTNIFVAGADLQDGLGPYVLHFNGECWTRLLTGASGTLWWISANPIGDAFYMVGDGGLILRYDITSGQFERQVTPGDATIFGVWGQSPDSIWAVGRNEADQSAVIWHYDGNSWQAVDLTGVVPGVVPNLFKIWGRNENDIYAVGRAGLILHYDGERWAQVASNTIRPLFGVYGNDDIVVATGGFNDGVIIEDSGAGFVARTPPGVKQLNGVFVPTNGTAVSVGISAAMALRDADGWVNTAAGLDTAGDFHAVWLDSEGGLWAVGGALSTGLSNGLLVYGGTLTIPTEINMGGACGNETTVE